MLCLNFLMHLILLSVLMCLKSFPILILQFEVVRILKYLPKKITLNNSSHAIRNLGFHCEGSNVKFLIRIYQICLEHSISAHSRFRGLVNCWAPSMENSFQVAKFFFEFQKSSSIFCLVQNCPAVIWVACIGLREFSSGP